MHFSSLLGIVPFSLTSLPTQQILLSFHSPFPIIFFLLFLFFLLLLPSLTIHLALFLPLPCSSISPISTFPSFSIILFAVPNGIPISPSLPSSFFPSFLIFSSLHLPCLPLFALAHPSCLHQHVMTMMMMNTVHNNQVREREKEKRQEKREKKYTTDK